MIAIIVAAIVATAGHVVVVAGLSAAVITDKEWTRGYYGSCVLTRAWLGVHR